MNKLIDPVHAQGKETVYSNKNLKLDWAEGLATSPGDPKLGRAS